MPRIPRDKTTTTKGKRPGRRSAAGGHAMVDQIAKIVAANEALRRENQELVAQNQHLQVQLREIGNALGRLTGNGRRRRGRVPVQDILTTKPRRQRKPITDPQILEKRRDALARARQVRAERLAAAKAGAERPG